MVNVGDDDKIFKKNSIFHKYFFFQKLMKRKRKHLEKKCQQKSTWSLIISFPTDKRKDS